MRIALACLALVMSCDAGSPEVDNRPMEAAPDSNTRTNSRIDEKIVLGATLELIENANLRDGPSANDLVLRIVPAGSKVIVTSSTSSRNGFYYVRHDGLIGWMNGSHLRFGAAPAIAVVENEPFTPDDPPPPVLDNDPPPVSAPSGDEQQPPPAPPGMTKVEQAIARAQSGVGFSYWWGGSRWDPAGASTTDPGSCSGVCGDCTHSGHWGADCSGYVAKIWQTPPGNDDLTVANHSYSTITFTNASYHWRQVDRGAVQIVDAFTYNTDGKGHIFLYESGDAWGSVWAYEAKGCSIGIVHNLRDVSSTYKAIRHEDY